MRLRPLLAPLVVVAGHFGSAGCTPFPFLFDSGVTEGDCVSTFTPEVPYFAPYVWDETTSHAYLLQIGRAESERTFCEVPLVCPSSGELVAACVDDHSEYEVAITCDDRVHLTERYVDLSGDVSERLVEASFDHRRRSTAIRVTTESFDDERTFTFDDSDNGRLTGIEQRWRDLVGDSERSIAIEVDSALVATHALGHSRGERRYEAWFTYAENAPTRMTIFAADLDGDGVVDETQRYLYDEDGRATEVKIERGTEDRFVRIGRCCAEVTCDGELVELVELPRLR